MTGALRGVSWCLALLAVDWVAESGILSRSCSALLGWLPYFPTRAVIPAACLCPQSPPVPGHPPVCGRGWQGPYILHSQICSICSLAVAQRTPGGSCHSAVGTKSTLRCFLLHLFSVRPVLAACCSPLASRSFHLPSYKPMHWVVTAF